MKGSCTWLYCLWGCDFRCSKSTGHRGRHAARITNSPLGWIVAVWA